MSPKAHEGDMNALFKFERRKAAKTPYAPTSPPEVKRTVLKPWCSRHNFIWSRKFELLLEVDLLRQKTIRNDEEKPAFSRVRSQSCARRNRCRVEVCGAIEEVHGSPDWSVQSRIQMILPLLLSPLLALNTRHNRVPPPDDPASAPL